MKRQIRKCRRSANSHFESLESRSLLSAIPSVLNYSGNWSGYAVIEKANDSVSAVSGGWTVPAVSGRGRGYSADWVGIDGYSSSTVEQLGTESDAAATSQSDGTPQYYAWFEMYPANSWIIPDSVKPGDAVTASVQFVGSSHTEYTAKGNARTGVYTSDVTTTTKALNDNFQLTITDSTEDWTFSITQSVAYHSDQRNSAEWIVEAPSNGSSTLPLASFGSVTVTSAQATINGTSEAIGSNPPANLNSSGNPISSGWTAIDMVNRFNQTIAATSTLNAEGNSFTVTAGSQTPAAPGASSTTTTSSGTSNTTDPTSPGGWDGPDPWSRWHRGW